ncbi:MAG TPA: hypothetical protein DD400_04075 [Rhodospirillaceae bacterium]|nr:hypothetical protein [Rhodospirillaceae bacterium]
MTNKRPTSTRTTSRQSPKNVTTQEEQQPKTRRTKKAAQREQDRIGDILRRVREHRGETVQEIATHLCIRARYLTALEGSHYDYLPADAYVIGFLQTYASYLELDGRGAVDQYRREMAGRRRKPQLSMPQPMSEGRTPTIPLLIGGLLAALVVYGIWYGLSTPDRAVIEAPLPLPSSVNEIPTTEESVLGESSVFIQTATLPKVAEIDAIIIEADAPKATPEAIMPTEEETTANKTYGVKEKSRVTVEAQQDSWILITDEKGLTVFDQILKSGESYNVPAQKKLRLTTGNAGGLGIILDGKKMPKIRANGKIARGLPLDPDKLKKRLSKKEESEEND